MRITSKGQVTIPQFVREQTGLLPNTDVEFVVDGGEVRIIKAVSGRRPSRGAVAVQTLSSVPTDRHLLRRSCQPRLHGADRDQYGLRSRLRLRGARARRPSRALGVIPEYVVDSIAAGAARFA